jgi:hypothetical protein
LPILLRPYNLLISCDIITMPALVRTCNGKCNLSDHVTNEDRFSKPSVWPRQLLGGRSGRPKGVMMCIRYLDIANRYDNGKEARIGLLEHPIQDNRKEV